MLPWPRREGRAGARFFPLMLAAGVLLAGCDGENLFPTLPAGAGGSGGTETPGAKPDNTIPWVKFAEPIANSTFAVGDSVFVHVGIKDDAAITSLELSGFTLKGDANLGTLERVDRFATKTVNFEGMSPVVRDTTIKRYLLATPDSAPDSRVYLVALVKDNRGNQKADTVQVAIGGPSVHIKQPLDGQEVRAGEALRVRIAAADRLNRIRSVTLKSTGAVRDSVVLSLTTLAEQVDTVIVVQVPLNATGELVLEPTAMNSRNTVATGRRVAVRVLPASADQVPPTVTFEADVRTRAERDDTLRIAVSATDNARVDSVGVSVIARWGNGQSTSTTRKAAAASRTFSIPLGALGLPALADTMSVSLEITAFARDASNNCGAATVPGIGLIEPCRTTGDGAIASDRAGARFDVFLVRGRTIGLSTATDRVADMASDGRRVFLSNLSRNRIDVLEIGQGTIGSSISVGSEPWGLALDRTNDTLFVANSGGTNISVVPLAGGGALSESRRIQTADIRLYDVTFDVTADTASLVVDLDYSDRPQFLARTASGRIVYSTKPTGTRKDGTVRILDPVLHNAVAFNRGSEIFVGYGTHVQGKATVVNALSAGRVPGGRIRVCPRPVPHSAAAPPCFDDLLSAAALRLAEMRAAGETDTRIDLIDAATIGLSDTTFVAVSGDRRSVAFGEGAISPGRIMLFHEQTGGELVGSTTQTRDLLGNAAERVIGLGLNLDGSLGVARGSQVYFFNDNLRLQGVVRSGSPAGGISLHPESRSYGSGPSAPGLLSFASGYDERGHPYVDVINTHSFRTVRRLFVRDGVVGSLVSTRTADGTFYVYALTKGGVVEIRLTTADLSS